MDTGALARDDAGNPLLLSPASWGGLPICKLSIPGDKVVLGRRGFSDPWFQIALSGLGTRRLRVGGRTWDVGTRPGSVVLYPRALEIHHTEWHGTPGIALAIRFPPVVLRKLLGEDAERFLFKATYDALDEDLGVIAGLLAREAASGAPNGPLFSEGLSLTFLGALLTRYGDSASHAERGRPKFSQWQRTKIDDYIHAHLGSDLRIELLADLLGMSSHQFIRRFKTSFDMSPHRYVVARRIEAASSALSASRDTPIAQIALACGFSSQAHFSEAFRRLTGRTPAAARFS